jgi:hypothetical protein
MQLRTFFFYNILIPLVFISCFRLLFFFFSSFICRGVSYTFGHDVIQDFLGRHDLDLICRAHQVVEDGYKFQANRQLVTVFSAPNYCGEFDNAGAILVVRQDLVCSFKVMRPHSHKERLEEAARFLSEQQNGKLHHDYDPKK